MGINHAESRRFTSQIVQDATKHCVLKNIGKIAGVEFMLIIHDASCQLDRRPAYWPNCKSLCHNVIRALCNTLLAYLSAAHGRHPGLVKTAAVSSDFSPVA